MSGIATSSAKLETLNPTHNRVERYQSGLNLIPTLIEKNYPSIKVIKILNRAGVLQEDNYMPLGTLRGKGVEFFIPNMVGVRGVKGGDILQETMENYGMAVDELIQSEIEPYKLAAWAFLILGVIHPMSGTGRTQRLFTNYILQKKGQSAISFPLKEGHLDHLSTIVKTITAFNQMIQDESSKTSRPRQEIINELINNARNKNLIESGFVDELASIFRMRKNKI